MTDVDWVPTKVDLLKTKWAAGFSASQIAAEIGCSRSAVIGKIHRLHLKRDELGIRQERRFREYGTRELPKPRPPQPKRSRSAGYVSVLTRPEVARAPPVTNYAEPQLDPQHITFEELQPQHCKFPFGKGPYTFCGLDRHGSSGPYCIGHARLCYSPSQRR